MSEAVLRKTLTLALALVSLIAASGAAAAVPAYTAQQSHVTAAQWGAPRPFDLRQGEPRTISCPSVDFCAVLDARGGLFIRSDRRWSMREQLKTRATLISCVSRTFCAALSDHGRATLFDGTSWSSAEVADEQAKPLALFCLTESFCMGVDAGGAVLTYDGTDWARASIDDSALNDVSCTSETFCMAVGSLGDVWHFDGVTWTVTAGVAPDGGAGISCSSETWCAVVDNSHGVETFDGTSWTAPLRIDDAAFLTDVSCVTGSFCMAVDDHGRGFVFDGTTWNFTGVQVPLGAVSCVRVGRCVAIGPEGDAVVYARDWHAPRPIDPQAGWPTSVSCPSGRFCMAVDEFGTSIELRDGSWRSPEDQGQLRLDAVSCSSSDFCAAVGEFGTAFTYEDRAWSDRTLIAVTNDVSCASPTFCMAVGSHPFTAVFDGTEWTWVDISHRRSLVGVSCPVANFCVALGNNGAVYTYGQGGWGEGSRFIGKHGQVSCSSGTSCVAIARAGDYSVFDGSGWSAAVPSGGRDVTSVSCAIDGVCMAVTEGNQALRYDADSWTESTVLDANGRGFTGISCWDRDACRAVNKAGHVLTYE